MKLLLLLTFCSIACHAQKNGIGLVVGYGMPIAGHPVTIYKNPDSPHANPPSGGTVYQRSFGSGFNGRLFFERKTNEHLSFCFGYEFLKGSNLFSKTTTGNTFKATSHKLLPAIKFSLTGKNGCMYYQRSGVVFSGFNKIELQIFNSTTPTSISYTEKYFGGYSIGYSGAIGILAPLGSETFINFELNCSILNWSPQHSSVTSFTVNGTDQLSQLTVRDRETNYGKTIEVPNSSDNSSPYQTYKQYLPFSSIGFNFGIVRYFGKTTPK
jgi:hypothetical protein